MEEPYDDVVALAAYVFDAPMASVTLIDEHRQWFKAQTGLNCSETDIESSFCAHAVEKRETLIVEDACLDPRFVNNALVVDEPFIRFYAGAPIYADGVAVGTVCVIDYRPRRPLIEQIAMLETLARQVGVLLSLRQTSRRLVQSEARFETFMAHAPILAYIKDEEGRYVYMSPLGGEAYGAEIDEITGTADSSWIDSETLAELHRHEEEVRESGRAIRRDFRATVADGVARDWSVVKFPFEDPSGGRLIGAIAHDVTMQKDAERLVARHLAASRSYAERLEDTNLLLETLAATDGLTGLLNQRAFQAEYAARLTEGEFALVMVDIDRFKALNDDFGHQEGDAVIQRIAMILKVSTRAHDLVGRLGGEEFAVLLHGADLACATRAAERMRTAIEVGPWENRPVTASFGVAVWTSGDTREGLLHRADNALYRAKQAGRDRVAIA